MRDFSPHYVAAYVFLEQDDKLLLLKRQNTGYRDGQYTVPSGHKESDEFIIDAAIRELAEETGIVVQAEDLQHFHTMYRKVDRNYLDFYFWCTNFTGEPTNVEPHKCSELAWFAQEELPTEFFGYLKKVLEYKQQGIQFSEIEVDY